MKLQIKLIILLLIGLFLSCQNEGQVNENFDENSVSSIALINRGLIKQIRDYESAIQDKNKYDRIDIDVEELIQNYGNLRAIMSLSSELLNSEKQAEILSLFKETNALTESILNRKLNQTVWKLRNIEDAARKSRNELDKLINLQKVDFLSKQKIISLKVEILNTALFTLLLNHKINYEIEFCVFDFHVSKIYSKGGKLSELEIYKIADDSDVYEIMMSVDGKKLDFDYNKAVYKISPLDNAKDSLRVILHARNKFHTYTSVLTKTILVNEKQ